MELSGAAPLAVRGSAEVSVGDEDLLEWLEVLNAPEAGGTPEPAAAQRPPRGREESADTKRRRGGVQEITRADGSVYFRVQIVDPFDPHGRRRLSISDRSRRAVEERAELVRREIGRAKLTGDWEPVRPLLRAASQGPYTVAQAWERYVELVGGKWKEQAASTWGRLLEPYVAELPVAQLDEEALRGWLAQVSSLRTQTKGKPYAGSTLRNAWDLLAAAVRLAVADGHLSALPWRTKGPGAWEPPTKGNAGEREAFRSVDEAQRLLAAAHQRDQRIAAMRGYADLYYRMGVGWLLCLRQGEIGGLGWHDFENLDGETDPTGPVLFQIVRQVKDGWRKTHPDATAPPDPPKYRKKGDKDPPIKVHGSCVELLLAQRENLRRMGWYRPDGPVFPATHGKHAGDWRSHADAIHPDREFWPVVEAAGLPGTRRRWTPHALRISGASLEALFSGGDLKATALRTRHRDLKVLQRHYIRATGRGLPESALPQIEGIRGPAAGAKLLPAAERPGLIIDSDPWGVHVTMDPGRATYGEQLAEEERARSTKRERRERQREAFVGKDAGTMAKIWRDHLRTGMASPPALQAALKAVYNRVFQARMRLFGVTARRELTPEHREMCEKAAARARNGLLGRWERFRKAQGG